MSIIGKTCIVRTILEMSADNVQFKMDLTKAAINGHKLKKLISDLVESA